MRKYLYTTLLLALLAQEGVMAQENEGKKGGFLATILLRMAVSIQEK